MTWKPPASPPALGDSLFCCRASAQLEQHLPTAPGHQGSISLLLISACLVLKSSFSQPPRFAVQLLIYQAFVPILESQEEALFCKPQEATWLCFAVTSECQEWLAHLLQLRRELLKDTSCSGSFTEWPLGITALVSQGTSVETEASGWEMHNPWRMQEPTWCFRASLYS